MALAPDRCSTPPWAGGRLSSARWRMRASAPPRYFSATPGTEAKILATALGGGILIDATIIRGILTPAAVAILGRWNWWLPDWAARILRVGPSQAQPDETPPDATTPEAAPQPA